MSEIIQGKITFINHDKGYAILEYEQGNKKKVVRTAIDEKTQKEAKEKGQIKKTHHFMVGDVVSFRVRLSDRGDKMIADKTTFLYNNALDVLLNKSLLNNKFIGYLKVVDDKYFVKEIDSYLFFPVPFSPWQIFPAEHELNEQVTFSLENTHKKEKIFASLFNNKYIPEFEQAVKLFKSKTPVVAAVTKVSPNGIYLNIIGDKIQAKLPASANENSTLKAGDKINVLITHLAKNKIAVEAVNA
jgi:cold shock CspA family protein